MSANPLYSNNIIMNPSFRPIKLGFKFSSFSPFIFFLRLRISLNVLCIEDSFLCPTIYENDVDKALKLEIYKLERR